MSGSVFVRTNPVVMRGPAGNTQELNPGGLGSTPIQWDWETETDEPVSVELRIKCKELRGLNSRSMPLQLRWQITSYGHGGTVFEPLPWQYSQLGAAASNLRNPDWPLPARGLCVRLNARKLTVLLKCYENNIQPLVQLSAMPLDVSGLTPWPRVDLGYPADAPPAVGVVAPQGGQGFFPAEAMEWRLDRWRFVDTATGWVELDPTWPVVYFGMQGNAAGGSAMNGAAVAAGTLFDWTPIPLAAAQWQLGRSLTGGSIPAGAQYR